MSVRHSPLQYIFISLTLGIVIQKIFSVDFVWIVLGFTMLLTAVFVFWRRSLLSALVILVMLFVLGALYFNQHNTFSDDHVVRQARFYYGKEVYVKGLVVSDVDIKETMRGWKTSFVMEVQYIDSGFKRNDVKGKILVNIFRDADVYYGDLIVVKGKLHQPFNFKTDGKFSYRKFLNNKHIYSILSVKKASEVEILSRDNGNYIRRQSLKMRRFIKELFSNLLTKNEAGIMHAIVLGDRTGIPDHIRELFVRTGTAHVLAISGLHIGIVSALMWIILRIFRFPRCIQLAGTIVLLAGYVFLTGGRPSVIRAFIMAVIFLLSLLIEREQNLFNTLAAAGIVLLVLNPNVLFDIGFQLSFGCLFSILLVVPRVEKIFLNVFKTKSPNTKKFISTFSYSLGVWLGIVGVIVYYFEIITPISVVANLFVIPLLAVVLALSSGMIISSILFYEMAGLFAICLKIVLNMAALVIYLFSRVPFSHFFIKDVNIWIVISYYAFLILLLAVIFPEKGKKSVIKTLS